MRFDYDWSGFPSINAAILRLKIFWGLGFWAHFPESFKLVFIRIFFFLVLGGGGFLSMEESSGVSEVGGYMGDS